MFSRGGKYGCQVLQCTEADDGEMRFECVAYFPSAYAENAPYDNPYLEMHEHLGQLVRDAVLRRKILIPDPKNPRYATFVDVEPPQWLIDEVQRSVVLADKVEAKTNDLPPTARS